MAVVAVEDCIRLDSVATGPRWPAGSSMYLGLAYLQFDFIHIDLKWLCSGLQKYRFFGCRTTTHQYWSLRWYVHWTRADRKAVLCISCWLGGCISLDQGDRHGTQLQTRAGYSLWHQSLETQMVQLLEGKVHTHSHRHSREKREELGAEKSSTVMHSNKLIFQKC